MRARDLDPVGVVLLGTGVLCLLLPFVQSQQWHGGTKWLLLVLAAALLTAFVAWEARCAGGRTRPVLDLALFRLRSYWLGCLLILLYFAGFTSIFFVTTLYLQSGLGYSALQAGLAISPFAIGSGVAATIGGRLVGRFGRPLVVVGLAMVAIGLAGTALAVHQVPGQNAGWAMAAPLLFGGLGSGLVIAPNQTLTLSEVPVANAGSAGGTLQTGQRVGSAIGIAAVGSVFFAQVTHDGWATAYDHGLIVSVAFVCSRPPGRDRRRGGGAPGRRADAEGIRVDRRRVTRARRRSSVTSPGTAAAVSRRRAANGRVPGSPGRSGRARPPPAAATSRCAASPRRASPRTGC